MASCGVSPSCPLHRNGGFGSRAEAQRAPQRVAFTAPMRKHRSTIKLSRNSFNRIVRAQAEDPKASGNLDVTDSKDDEAKQQQVLVVAEEQGPEAALERATEESSSSPEELASVEAAGDQGDTRTRKQLWKAAIKLPMYSVAVVPLMVGAAAAFMETGFFAATQVCGILVASLLIILWLNLSNDAFDADTEVDKTKAESVVNLLGGKKAPVLIGANLALVLGAALMGASLASVGDMRVVGWLTAAVACGYVYQGPPFRLSYKGLGEPLCFAAFGPLATGAFYLANRGPAMLGASLTPVLWACAVIVGITTTSILFCSHFHQIEGDRAAGKMSPLVRLGTEGGAKVIDGMVVIPYMMLAIGTAMKLLPWPLAIASFASLPWAMKLGDYVNKNHSTPEMIRFAKLVAIEWHCAMGAALTAGLAALRMIPDIPFLPPGVFF